MERLLMHIAMCCNSVLRHKKNVNTTINRYSNTTIASPSMTKEPYHKLGRTVEDEEAQLLQDPFLLYKNYGQHYALLPM
uniref:Uncharacterized protein n=1 Tax=Rhizophora mucronata TaxID=61149 RepID=A0A2P2NH39_RHIMU